MNPPRFSDDVLPLTDLKTSAGRIVHRLRCNRRPMLLTRRGRGVAVLLDLEDYERLVDRSNFIEAVEKGMQAARAGDLHSHKEAEKILNTFGEPHA
jgi:prevent-host-death family protein